MAQLLHLKAGFKSSTSCGRNISLRSTERHVSAHVKWQRSSVDEPERQPPASWSTPAATCVQQAFRLGSSQPGSTLTLMLLATAIGGLSLVVPEAASAADGVSSGSYHPNEIVQIAEDDEFWGNVLRYIRYFFTVTSGGLYALASPFLNLFKKPTTAVLAVGVAVGAVYVLQFTLNAMLGITEPFEYTPSSLVTNAASPYVANF